MKIIRRNTESGSNCQGLLVKWSIAQEGPESRGVQKIVENSLHCGRTPRAESLTISEETSPGRSAGNGCDAVDRTQDPLGL